LRIGVMGGTFDPIHIGHLVAAEEARFQFELDRVVFVPSARPPHKGGVSSSPPEARLAMVSLAVEGNPFLEVTDLELVREGLSYTIDTLRSFHSQYGSQAELFFITGADAILELLTWKDPEELLAESSFIAATRPGFDLKKLKEALPPVTSKGTDASKSVNIMEIPALGISSTDIRQRVAAGKPFRYMVCGAVWEYITSERLYLGTGAPSRRER
jgi:nicotinate-nucleotide adenylyltransferase